MKNLIHGFVDEKAMIKTNLMSSCHLKTLVPFCLWKKRSENALLTLTVNYRKSYSKKIIPFKTTVNCLLNNIWCYLFIAFFDCKIVVFQQIVVMVIVSLILSSLCLK